MEEAMIVTIVLGILFVALPWLIFHYVTKWKTAKTLTGADEQLLDDLHDAARAREPGWARIQHPCAWAGDRRVAGKL